MNTVFQEYETSVESIFGRLAKRVDDKQMRLVRNAYELAAEAHKGQKRKTGEPYIIHPIAVARIVAEELELEANPVMAAFLHDVVEDTQYTIEDIRERFGDDVAFLVGVVTKQKKEKYDKSKQVDNYRQILASVQYDVRAILVKLADRLHNMRTLASMRPDKQMKIAGETDYFYAPLANRLGLYHVKTELENLSLHYRCPREFEQIERMLEETKQAEEKNLEGFISKVSELLEDNGIKARIELRYRMPTASGARCDPRDATSITWTANTISASSMTQKTRARRRSRACTSTPRFRTISRSVPAVWPTTSTLQRRMVTRAST